MKFGSAPRIQAFVTPARPPFDTRSMPGTSRRTSAPLRAAEAASSGAATTVTAPTDVSTGCAVTVVVS